MLEECNSVLSTPTEADKIGHFLYISKTQISARPIYQSICNYIVLCTIFYFLHYVLYGFTIQCQIKARSQTCATRGPHCNPPHGLVRPTRCFSSNWNPNELLYISQFFVILISPSCITSFSTLSEVCSPWSSQTKDCNIV